MVRSGITIYDIAEEVGVSTASVSRVLSGHPNVSQKMRVKVMAVVEKYHFMPSLQAQTLEKGKAKMIGIILPDITNPYYATLYTYASEEAKKHGYSTWMCQLPNNLECINAEIVEMLIKQRLRGAFFVGGLLEMENQGIIKAITNLRQYMPLVAICPPIENLNCICLHNDLATAMRQAVFHLYGFGHRAIAFLGGSSLVRSSGARGRGFLNALEELGLENPNYYQHEAGYSCEAGEIAVSKLLTNLPHSKWPTALICFNDLIAIGAMKMLRHLGVRIPEDMAIIGCDNCYFSCYTEPPLTSIDLDPARHAQLAIQELLRENADKAAPFSRARDATLIIRESCGAKKHPLQQDAKAANRK